MAEIGTEAEMTVSSKGCVPSGSYDGLSCA
jgi:hypothetical protein